MFKEADGKMNRKVKKRAKELAKETGFERTRDSINRTYWLCEWNKNKDEANQLAKEKEREGYVSFASDDIHEREEGYGVYIGKKHELIKELGLDYLGALILVFLSIITGLFLAYKFLNSILIWIKDEERTSLVEEIGTGNIVASGFYLGAIYLFTCFPLTKHVVYEVITNGVSSGVIEYTTITGYVIVGVFLMLFMVIIVWFTNFSYGCEPQDDICI